MLRLIMLNRVLALAIALLNQNQEDMIIYKGCLTHTSKPEIRKHSALQSFTVDDSCMPQAWT